MASSEILLVFYWQNESQFFPGDKRTTFINCVVLRYDHDQFLIFLSFGRRSFSHVFLQDYS